VTLNDREAVQALARRVEHVAAIAALIAESHSVASEKMLELSFAGISNMLHEVASQLRAVTDAHSPVRQ
jgi:chorismate mutase